MWVNELQGLFRCFLYAVFAVCFGVLYQMAENEYAMTQPKGEDLRVELYRHGERVHEVRDITELDLHDSASNRHSADIFCLVRSQDDAFVQFSWEAVVGLEPLWMRVTRGGHVVMQHKVLMVSRSIAFGELHLALRPIK